MNNRNNINSLKWYSYLFGYAPFFMIALAVFGNLFTLFVIRTNSSLRKQSSMMVFSFISIIDLFALFTWNLDAYFRIFYNFDYEYNNLVLCRLMVFLQFFGKETNAILLSFISIDRYVTIISKPGSFVSKLPFGTSRTSFIWSCCITLFTFLLNSHILILNGYFYEKYSNKTNITKETLECYVYETGFKIKTSWNLVDLIIYSLIPFLVMMVFNSLIILKTIRQGKNLNRSSKQSIKLYHNKRKLTISLVLVTFLFLIFTLPETIFFAFFFNYSNQTYIYVGLFLNTLMFFHHSSLFLVLLTNSSFRKALANLKKLPYRPSFSSSNYK